MGTEAEIRKAEEYEMQLFGFTSRALCATLNTLIEDQIESSCKKLYESLCKNLKADESNAPDVEILANAYRSRLDPHRRMIENCAKKFFTIPRNVLLEEDKCQAVSLSEEPRDVMNRLKSLQSRAKRAAMLHAALTDELESIREIESMSGLVETTVNSINDSMQLDTHTQGMKKLVLDFRGFMETVPSANGEPVNMYAGDLSRNVRLNQLNLDRLQPSAE